MATIYFLFVVREVLLTFIFASFLAYILFRPVLFIEKWGIPRIWAILLLYLILIAIFSTLLALAIPGLVRELGELGKLLPGYAEEASDLAKQLDNTSMPARFNEVVRENIGKIESLIYSSLQNFITIMYNLLGKVLAIIFSPILAFYILNDWEKIRETFLKLFSPAARRALINLFSEIDLVLIEFFKGHLLVATFVGVLIGFLALILGVNFPLLIGILSGITNLIPFFGAFLGGIPAVAVALSESFKLALYMTIGIFVVQQIESNLITPNVIGGKLGLHPLVIVFVLLAGGKLAGIWGMLLAVPLAAILKIIVKWLYLKLIVL